MALGHWAKDYLGPKEAGGSGGGGATVYTLTTDDYNETTHEFTGPLAETVYAAAKTGPVVFIFPETSDYPEIVSLLVQAGEALNVELSGPYIFDFSGSAPLTYGGINSDGHMLIEVYVG